ncbi:putative uncharacterized protein DDB_G0282133 [Stomoxys calcitrans]|uniref:putative uncharacterized protein DDB_G0282133 n=1 Tax=Stomoxys calcitrans TaxID=35570 RepID=UPI0027E33F6F|nr:putative uncharacterized protein DDB_G0282133 [Stomoxys calcitrans]
MCRLFLVIKVLMLKWLLASICGRVSAAYDYGYHPSAEEFDNLLRETHRTWTHDILKHQSERRVYQKPRLPNSEVRSFVPKFQYDSHLSKFIENNNNNNNNHNNNNNNDQDVTGQIFSNVLGLSSPAPLNNPDRLTIQELGSSLDFHYSHDDYAQNYDNTLEMEDGGPIPFLNNNKNQPHKDTQGQLTTTSHTMPEINLKPLSTNEMEKYSLNNLYKNNTKAHFPIYFTNPATGIVYAITEMGKSSSNVARTNGSIPIFITKEQYERDIMMLKQEYEAHCNGNAVLGDKTKLHKYPALSSFSRPSTTTTTTSTTMRPQIIRLNRPASPTQMTTSKLVTPLKKPSSVVVRTELTVKDKNQATTIRPITTRKRKLKNKKKNKNTRPPGHTTPKPVATFEGPRIVMGSRISTRRPVSELQKLSTQLEKPNFGTTIFSSAPLAATASNVDQYRDLKRTDRVDEQMDFDTMQRRRRSLREQRNSKGDKDIENLENEITSVEEDEHSKDFYENNWRKNNDYRLKIVQRSLPVIDNENNNQKLGGKVYIIKEKTPEESRKNEVEHKNIDYDINTKRLQVIDKNIDYQILSGKDEILYIIEEESAANNDEQKNIDYGIESKTTIIDNQLKSRNKKKPNAAHKTTLNSYKQSAGKKEIRENLYNAEDRTLRRNRRSLQDIDNKIDLQNSDEQPTRRKGRVLQVFNQQSPMTKENNKRNIEEFDYLLKSGAEVLSEYDGNENEKNKLKTITADKIFQSDKVIDNKLDIQRNDNKMLKQENVYFLHSEEDILKDSKKSTENDKYFDNNNLKIHINGMNHFLNSEYPNSRESKNSNEDNKYIDNLKIDMNDFEIIDDLKNFENIEKSPQIIHHIFSKESITHNSVVKESQKFKEKDKPFDNNNFKIDNNNIEVIDYFKNVQKRSPQVEDDNVMNKFQLSNQYIDDKVINNYDQLSILKSYVFFNSQEDGVLNKFKTNELKSEEIDKTSQLTKNLPAVIDNKLNLENDNNQFEDFLNTNVETNALREDEVKSEHFENVAKNESEPNKDRAIKVMDNNLNVENDGYQLKGFLYSKEDTTKIQEDKVKSDKFVDVLSENEVQNKKTDAVLKNGSKQKTKPIVEEDDLAINFAGNSEESATTEENYDLVWKKEPNLETSIENPNNINNLEQKIKSESVPCLVQEIHDETENLTWVLNYLEPKEKNYGTISEIYEENVKPVEINFSTKTENPINKESLYINENLKTEFNINPGEMEIQSLKTENNNNLELVFKLVPSDIKFSTKNQINIENPNNDFNALESDGQVSPIYEENINIPTFFYQIEETNDFSTKNQPAQNNNELQYLVHRNINKPNENNINNNFQADENVNFEQEILNKNSDNMGTKIRLPKTTKDLQAIKYWDIETNENEFNANKESEYLVYQPENYPSTKTIKEKRKQNKNMAPNSDLNVIPLPIKANHNGVEVLVQEDVNIPSDEYFSTQNYFLLKEPVPKTYQNNANENFVHVYLNQNDNHISTKTPINNENSGRGEFLAQENIFQPYNVEFNAAARKNVGNENLVHIYMVQSENDVSTKKAINNRNQNKIEFLVPENIVQPINDNFDAVGEKNNPNKNLVHVYMDPSGDTKTPKINENHNKIKVLVQENVFPLNHDNFHTAAEITNANQDLVGVSMNPNLNHPYKKINSENYNTNEFLVQENVFPTFNDNFGATAPSVFVAPNYITKIVTGTENLYENNNLVHNSVNKESEDHDGTKTYTKWSKSDDETEHNLHLVLKNLTQINLVHTQLLNNIENLMELLEMWQEESNNRKKQNRLNNNDEENSKSENKSESAPYLENLIENVSQDQNKDKNFNQSGVKTKLIHYLWQLSEISLKQHDEINTSFASNNPNIETNIEKPFNMNNSKASEHNELLEFFKEFGEGEANKPEKNVDNEYSPNALTRKHKSEEILETNSEITKVKKILENPKTFKNLKVAKSEILKLIKNILKSKENVYSKLNTIMEKLLEKSFTKAHLHKIVHKLSEKILEHQESLEKGLETTKMLSNINVEETLIGLFRTKGSKLAEKLLVLEKKLLQLNPNENNENLKFQNLIESLYKEFKMGNDLNRAFNLIQNLLQLKTYGIKLMKNRDGALKTLIHKNTFENTKDSITTAMNLKENTKILKIPEMYKNRNKRSAQSFEDKAHKLFRENNYDDLMQNMEETPFKVRGNLNDDDVDNIKNSPHIQFEIENAEVNEKSIARNIDILKLTEIPFKVERSKRESSGEYVQNSPHTNVNNKKFKKTHEKLKPLKLTQFPNKVKRKQISHRGEKLLISPHQNLKVENLKSDKGEKINLELNQVEVKKKDNSGENHYNSPYPNFDFEKYMKAHKDRKPLKLLEFPFETTKNQKSNRGENLQNSPHTKFKFKTFEVANENFKNDQLTQEKENENFDSGENFKNSPHLKLKAEQIVRDNKKLSDHNKKKYQLRVMKRLKAKHGENDQLNLQLYRKIKNFDNIKVNPKENRYHHLQKRSTTSTTKMNATLPKFIRKSNSSTGNVTEMPQNLPTTTLNPLKENSTNYNNIISTSNVSIDKENLTTILNRSSANSKTTKITGPSLQKHNKRKKRKRTHHKSRKAENRTKKKRKRLGVSPSALNNTGANQSLAIETSTSRSIKGDHKRAKGSSSEKDEGDFDFFDAEGAEEEDDDTEEDEDDDDGGEDDEEDDGDDDDDEEDDGESYEDDLEETPIGEDTSSAAADVDFGALEMEPTEIPATAGDDPAIFSKNTQNNPTLALDLKRIRRRPTSKLPAKQDYDDDEDEDEDDVTSVGSNLGGFFRMIFYPVQMVLSTIMDSFVGSNESSSSTSPYTQYTSYHNTLKKHASDYNYEDDDGDYDDDIDYDNDSSDSSLTGWFSSLFGFNRRNKKIGSTTLSPQSAHKPAKQTGWLQSWFGYDDGVDKSDTNVHEDESEYDKWFSSWFGEIKPKARKRTTTTTTTTTTQVPQVPILTIVDPMRNPQNWIGILAHHIINHTSTTTQNPLKEIWSRVTSPSTTTTTTENPDIPRKMSYNKYQIWRLKPQDDPQLQALEEYKQSEEGNKLQWLKGPSLRGLTDVLVPPRMLSDFQSSLSFESIDHEVLIFDVGKAIAYEKSKEDFLFTTTQNPKKRHNPHRHAHKKPLQSMTWMRYYEFDDIVTYMENMRLRYPQLVELIHIGRSYEGRPLIVVKIESKEAAAANSANLQPNQKSKLRHKKRTGVANAVFIEAGTHGAEWIAPASATWIINELLKIMKMNKTIDDEHSVIRNTTWYIMPVLNPDGYVYSHEYDRFWKKSRSRHISRPSGIINSAMTWLQKKKTTNRICYGVDLDRNWNYQWGKRGSSRTPCNEFFAGPAPFSEPETKALSEFLMDYRTHIKLYMSLQAYGQIISYPYKANTTYDTERLDDLLDVAMVGIDGLRKQGSKSRYKIDSTNDLVENRSGSSDAFVAYDVGIPFSYTIQLADNGVHGYLLPSAAIESTSRDAFEIILAMLDYI